ncbi:MAG: EF-hand domain-containing protein [Planctomycetota bacterium]
MRLTHSFLATLILSVFVSGSIMAQPPERDGARRRGAGAGGSQFGGRGGAAGGAAFMQMIPVMAALDANKDGRISSDEIENAAVALRKLDKNRDGQLTMDEIRPQGGGTFTGRRGQGAEGGQGRPGGAQGRPGSAQGRPGGTQGRPGMQGQQGRGEFMARMFQQRDANKDGKLSGDEIPEQMAGRLDRIDTDGDQAISKKELESAMSRAGSSRQRGGDQGGTPGGDRPRRPPTGDDQS